MSQKVASLVQLFSKLDPDLHKETIDILSDDVAQTAKATARKGVDFKVGDIVVITASPGIPKKFWGQPFKLMKLGPERAYLENPKHPGVQNKCFYPYIGQLSRASEGAEPLTLEQLNQL